MQNGFFSKTDIVSDIADAIAPPTKAPTDSPTILGMVMEEQEVVVSTLTTAIGFPLTEAQANNCVMQGALAGGVAASLGFDSDKVKVSKVGDTVSACGETTRRRLTDAKSVARRLTDTAIEFEITAPDAASVDTLQQSVASVATSGALVANVQQAAKNSGVLVKALKSMQLKLPEPTITVAEKTVTQLVMVETVAPTASPTASIPEVLVVKESDDLPVILGGVFGGLVVVLICVFVLTRGASAGSAEPSLTPQVANNV